MSDEKKLTAVADVEQMSKILEILEEMEDQELAVKLLKNFNDKSSELNLLLQNKDAQLNHNVWKMECDLLSRDLKRAVDAILAEG